MSNDDLEKSPKSGLSRRTFLGSVGGVVVGAGAYAAVDKISSSDAPNTSGAYRNAVEPFYGLHQGGIVSPAQSNTVLASFELLTSRRSDVVSLLKSWTNDGAKLALGQPVSPFSSDDDAVDRDSMDAYGLGASRLTLTFGFGAGLFESNGVDRYGVRHKKPAALIDLPTFRGDELDPARSGGDLTVQACADDPQVAFHAVRQLTRAAAGIAGIKWTQVGFNETPASPGTARDLLGFKDGTINPTPSQYDAYVWANSSGPQWMHGGTYLVARRILIDLTQWDKKNLGEQEQIIGRAKGSGAPLGEKSEFDALNLHAKGAQGNYLIPAKSHVRLSSQQVNLGQMILRRSYAFNEGTNYVAVGDLSSGSFDAGLLFCAYQYDPRDGFVPIFKRLSEHDALNEFTTHTGSVVVAIPPGAPGPGHYVGEGLFT